MEQPTDDWLREKNTAFRRDGVHPEQRSWLAWRALAMETGAPLALGDPSVQRIFSWFQDHAAADGQIGPFFRGVYFFDARFWPLELPPFFGTVVMNPLDSLATMPAEIVHDVGTSRKDREDFIRVWATTMDCALGFDELGRGPGGPESAALLLACRREIQVAVSALLERRPSRQASLSARFAVELILKWFLSTNGYSTDFLKTTFNHRVLALLEECGRFVRGGALGALRKSIAALPKIDDRYRGDELPESTLWEHYRTGIVVSARMMREKTGHDSITNMLR